MGCLDRLRHVRRHRHDRDPPRFRGNDMALDPTVRKLLDMAAASGRPAINSLPPPEARQMMRDTRPPVQGPFLESVASDDRRIAGPAGEITVRVYRPKVAAPGAK